MKTPWWEVSAGATIALLLTKTFVKAELYTIYLQGGGVLRYAAGLVDVSVPGGFYWTANAVVPDLQQGLGAARAHWKMGTDVDTWQVALAPRPTDRGGNLWPDTIGNVPWTQAIRAGMLDGSTIQVDRAVFPSWAGAVRSGLSFRPTGVVTVFKGPTAAIDFDHSATIISIQSRLQLLTQQIPRNVFQAGCRHTLFDAGCQLSAGAFAADGTCQAGTTQSVFQTNLSDPALPFGTGTYALGRIVMTSGRNNGFARAVRSWSAPAAKLIVPLPFEVAPGDTFVAYPGCDKTLGTCTAFGNNVNYGGEPNTPSPETAV